MTEQECMHGHGRTSLHLIYVVVCHQSGLYSHSLHRTVVYHGADTVTPTAPRRVSLHVLDHALATYVTCHYLTTPVCGCLLCVRAESRLS